MKLSVKIHKERMKAPFLQISHSDWKEAIRQMNYSTFVLYLYLASNADEYKCSIEQEEFEKDTGFKRTSYYEAIKTLKEMKYIVEDTNGELHFFTHACSDEMIDKDFSLKTFGDPLWK